ncbi:hypothetical protein QUQ67_000347 [Escherichia coli]|nr:hypothetical protein [Escherichia coli]
MGCVGLIYVIFYSGAMERIAKVFGNTENRMDMFKKSLLLTMVMCLLFSSFADAKRRYKRSYHRTQTHHYHRYNNASKGANHSVRGGDYFRAVDGANIEQSEEQEPTIQKKRSNKVNNRVSHTKTQQPDVRAKTTHQEKKSGPTCAPLHMAHQPGYTNLPICADVQY